MRSLNAVPFARTSYVGPHLSGERNDCAVRALMTVTGESYLSAHAELARSCGRRPGKGTGTWSLVNLLDSGEVLGARFEKMRIGVWGNRSGNGERAERMTLGTFVRRFPSGTFYVLKAGHAFAVVDGTLVDTWEVPAGSKLTGAWRVSRPAPAPVVVPAAPAPEKVSARKDGRAYKYPPPVRARREALDALFVALPREALRSIDAAIAALPAGTLDGFDFPRHEARCALKRLGIKNPPPHG